MTSVRGVWLGLAILCLPAIASADEPRATVDRVAVRYYAPIVKQPNVANDILSEAADCYERTGETAVAGKLRSRLTAGQIISEINSKAVTSIGEARAALRRGVNQIRVCYARVKTDCWSGCCRSAKKNDG